MSEKYFKVVSLDVLDSIVEKLSDIRDEYSEECIAELEKMDIHDLMKYSETEENFLFERISEEEYNSNISAMKERLQSGS